MSITLRGHMHETGVSVSQPLPTHPGHLVITIATGAAHLQTYATPTEARQLAAMFLDAAQALERHDSTEVAP